MIASPSSACGKTTATIALLRSLRVRAENGGEFSPVAFKCGPDFIDPLFHRSALGVSSGNLDTFFLSESDNRALFAHYAPEGSLAVIEGAMGYFDGAEFSSDKGSAAHIARALCTPVVLVVSADGAARSILAQIAGFLALDSGKNIAGVILNRVKSHVAAEMKKIIEQELHIKVFGYLEKNADFAINSRHLGLLTPDAVENLEAKISALAAAFEKTVDVDSIIDLAKSAPPLEIPDDSTGHVSCAAQKAREGDFDSQWSTKRPVAAVARDEAFCFYYRENIDALKAAGAEIIEFSPLHDRALPDCDALYLGGGYPEEFSDALFENTAMISQIRARVRGGLPTLAECGGFLFLVAMGVLGGTFAKKDSLVRFGYVNLRAERDTLLLRAGEEVRAHEFHYFDTTANGDALTATKLSGKSWRCGVSEPFSAEPSLPPFSETLNVFALFPHIFFPSNPLIAPRFVEIAARFHEEKGKIRSKCAVCPRHKSRKGGK